MKQVLSRERIIIAVTSLATLLALANLIAFSGRWSGDPEIHIIFARNLLGGHFLEFNQGMATSGETSIIYMLIISIMVAALSPEIVPFVMKLFGLAAAVASVVIATSPLQDRQLRLVLALYAFVIPSIMYQSMLGMENMAFAALTVFILRGAVLDREPRNTLQRDIGWILLGIVGFYLRPEAVILMFAVAVHRFFVRDWRSCALFLGGIGVSLLSVSVFEALTGAPLHGAGQIRALTSANASLFIDLGPSSLVLNPKPVYYLISTAALWLVAGYVLLTASATRALLRTEAPVFAAFLVMIGVPLMFHVTNIFPNTHFSRYQLYLFFSTLLLFAWLWERIREWSGRTGFQVIVLLVCAFGVFSFEHLARGESGQATGQAILTPAAAQELALSQSAKARAETSESYCALVGGCPRDRQTVVALQEVQLRMRLDDRFWIASLDGITDSDLADFVTEEGCIQHYDYLRHRSVDLLLEFPDYNARSATCDQSLVPVAETLKAREVFRYGDMLIRPAYVDEQLVGLVSFGGEAGN